MSDKPSDGKNTMIWPMAICAGCGMEISYPPIKLPTSEPIPVLVEVEEETKPGRYDAEYKNFCIDCVLGREGYALRWQIMQEQMLPKKVWMLINGKLIVKPFEEARSESSGGTVFELSPEPDNQPIPDDDDR